MKTIIAGSRELSNPSYVLDALMLKGWEITEVISGGANGVDINGARWAMCPQPIQDLTIPIKQFPADWDKHGKAAGPIRNQEMADYADALIAVWDGESRGTRDMIDKAIDGGLVTLVVTIR